MGATDPLSSGKGARNENFPVASALIAPRHRRVVLAFYAVARMADDIADHPVAAPAEKLARLAAIEHSLTGAGDEVAEAVALRTLLAERDLSVRHILDLLEAFRRDVTQHRYADWAELMDYCRYSAAPVGRFMLDVHDEDRATWRASDALCAALQVINHLQDCGKDYREIDRVYVPLDALRAEEVRVEAFAAPAASPSLRRVIAALADKTLGLLEEAAPFAAQVQDVRLALEIGVIHRLAVGLARGLGRRDPLSQRVHFRPVQAAAAAFLGASSVVVSRLGLGKTPRLRHRVVR